MYKCRTRLKLPFVHVIVFTFQSLPYTHFYLIFQRYSILFILIRL